MKFWIIAIVQWAVSFAVPILAKKAIKRNFNHNISIIIGCSWGFLIFSLTMVIFKRGDFSAIYGFLAGYITYNLFRYGIIVRPSRETIEELEEKEKKNKDNKDEK